MPYDAADDAVSNGALSAMLHSYGRAGCLYPILTDGGRVRETGLFKTTILKEELAMRGRYTFMVGIAAAIALSFAFLLFAPSESTAQDKFGCFIEATLSAPGAGDQEFLFEIDNLMGGGPSFTLMDGQSNGGILDEKEARIVNYIPTAGWAFGGIECESLGGLIVQNFDSSFYLECDNAKLGNATCTITLVKEASPIPTLSEWGMIAAAAGLVMIGVFFAVRKRRIATGV